MNASRRDLENQFRRVIDNGWLPMVQKYAKQEGITTACKLGRGSRETNLKNIRGDYRGGHYHGFGVEQVDIGTDPAYCRNWTPGNVEGGFAGGTRIFLTKVRDTLNCVGQKCTIRGRSFTGKAVDLDDLRRIATSAYNCGRWAHYHFSRGENVDTTTTGNDYSRDVYDRSVEFADMLERAGLDQNAVALELDQQGKYARTAHQKRFQHFVMPDRVKLPVGQPMESQDELACCEYEREPDNEPPATQDGSAADGLAALLNEQGPAREGVAEPGAGAELDPGGAPASPGEQQFSESRTLVTPQGERTVEQSLTVPAGDPPDAPPSHFFDIEDWKPWAIRNVSRIWKAVTGLTVPGGGGFGIAALNAGESWWIYVIAGVVIVVLLGGLGILATLVIVGIYLVQNRHIPLIKAEQLKILADPNMKNVGLNFIKK